jgi:hypothetical protein
VQISERPSIRAPRFHDARWVGVEASTKNRNWTSSWMRIIRAACCTRNAEKIHLGSMLTSLSSIQAERNH